MNTSVSCFTTVGLVVTADFFNSKTISGRTIALLASYLFLMSVLNSFNAEFARKFALLVFVGAVMGPGTLLARKLIGSK